MPAGELPYPLLDFLALGGPVQATAALRAAHKAATPRKGATLGEHVLAVGHHLAKNFEYRKDVTEYDSTTEDFLKIRRRCLPGLRPPDARRCCATVRFPAAT